MAFLFAPLLGAVTRLIDRWRRQIHDLQRLRYRGAAEARDQQSVSIYGHLARLYQANFMRWEASITTMKAGERWKIALRLSFNDTAEICVKSGQIPGLRG
jgi:hypothetical protein